MRLQIKWICEPPWRKAILEPGRTKPNDRFQRSFNAIIILYAKDAFVMECVDENGAGRKWIYKM
jgi:hypothetical protein